MLDSVVVRWQAERSKAEGGKAEDNEEDEVRRVEKGEMNASCRLYHERLFG